MNTCHYQESVKDKYENGKLKDPVQFSKGPKGRKKQTRHKRNFVKVLLKNYLCDLLASKYCREENEHQSKDAPRQTHESTGGRGTTTVQQGEVGSGNKGHRPDGGVAEQQQNTNFFISQKQKLGKLRSVDFEKISELGTGNGSMVQCIRHKVNLFSSFYNSVAENNSC